MTRIALLANYPPDHATFTTGVQTATAALVDGLRAYAGEFDLHVISPAGPIGRDVRESAGGIQFHFLGIPRHPWARPRLLWRTNRVLRELQRVNPHLVHCQDDMALGLAAVISGYPRMFTVHGVKRHEAAKRTGWEFWSALTDALLERYVHRHMDAFICISPYAAQVVGTRHPTVAIPNAVRQPFFNASAKRAELTAPRLLFAGVLTPLKRPADLLLAHAELVQEFPTLETLFCGAVEDARYAASMRAMVAERAIPGVWFLGNVAQEHLADLLATATALVLPSAQENAPMVIAEAMAVGVPVIASRVGGVASILREGETGWLYPSGSVAELTKHLRMVLSDAELCHQFGRAARRIAERTFHPSCVAEQTVLAYRKLLSGPNTDGEVYG